MSQYKKLYSDSYTPVGWLYTSLSNKSHYWTLPNGQYLYVALCGAYALQSRLNENPSADRCELCQKILSQMSK